MVRNLGHARPDGTANETEKNITQHIKRRRPYYENRLKTPITSLIQCKIQIVHWKPKTKSVISIENRRFRSCHPCGFQLYYGNKTVCKGS